MFLLGVFDRQMLLLGILVRQIFLLEIFDQRMFPEIDLWGVPYRGAPRERRTIRS
jgi:hypothetical protein